MVRVNFFFIRVLTFYQVLGPYHTQPLRPRFDVYVALCPVLGMY